MLIALLGATAVAVSLLSLVPQVRTARRTRVTDGISPGSTGLAVLACALWVAYAAGVADLAQVANNAAGLVLFALLAQVLGATGAVGRWWCPAVVAGSLALAALASVALPSTAAATVASAVGLLSRVPQVRVALSGTSLLGLDPWSVLLGALTPALWVVYGLAVADGVLVAGNVAAFGLAAVVGARRLPPRRTVRSLADGRLGPAVARAAAPVAVRFPSPALAAA